MHNLACAHSLVLTRASRYQETLIFTLFVLLLPRNPNYEDDKKEKEKKTWSKKRVLKMLFGLDGY